MDLISGCFLENHRDVFLKFVQKILFFVQKIIQTCRGSPQRRRRLILYMPEIMHTEAEKDSYMYSVMANHAESGRYLHPDTKKAPFGSVFTAKGAFLIYL